MTLVTLRPVQRQDGPALERLMTACFAEYARRLGRAAPGPYDWLHDRVTEGDVWWCDTADIAGVGTVVLSYAQEAVCLIDQLGIDPAHQGQGLGTAAMRAIEAQATQRGCTLMRLFTGQPLTELVAFYSRLGYRVVRVGPSPSGGDKYPRVFMEKQLAPDPS